MFEIDCDRVAESIQLHGCRSRPTQVTASTTNSARCGGSVGSSSPTAGRSRVASCAPLATLGIQTVAVHSDPDAAAPFVGEALFSVPLGGRTSAESYLDSAKILAAARRSGADAIHPGYGFLSENPQFAQAVMDAGLVWIGPTPEQMRAMALKVEAKRLVAEAGVPLVPGAELAADASPEAIAAAADAVGFPLLAKASAGGGGKGMRLVRDPAALLDEVSSARNEAASAFGDPTVFLERYLERSRHVEVQVFGDQHGNVVHLFERECSIQRRHQKVVEESPSPGATPETLAAMYPAAVAAARAIGYHGAGTVEFIVAGEGAEQVFYFLEMNTRLQVEHPVTELTTGLDLVEWQIRVARGERLPLTQDADHPVGARDRGAPVRRGSGQRLSAEHWADRLVRRLRVARCAGRHRRADRQRGLPLLRPDAGQAHRLRRDQGRGGGRPGRASRAIRGRGGTDQSRVAGGGPTLGCVPRRGHHHGVPRGEPGGAGASGASRRSGRAHSSPPRWGSPGRERWKRPGRRWRRWGGATCPRSRRSAASACPPRLARS